MKVSIIVPVYNSEKYLKDCLDSLVNQTLQEIEIIAIDDNSTDNSLNILKEYEIKYPSIVKVFHNEKNLGQSATRNKGIQIAKGEYIGFLDSDDYINYAMYQTMYEGAKAYNNPEVITTGLLFVKDNSYLENNFEGLNHGNGKIYSVLDNPNFILMQSPSVCNKLFRRDTLKDNLFLEGKMWEDVAFSFSKMLNANRVLVFQNPDYFYRRRINEGVSSKGYQINNHLLDIFTIADQIEKETKETNRYQLLQEQVRFIQITTCLQRIEEIMTWPISDDSKNELYQLMNSIMIQKYGNWRDIPLEELSTRIGFFTLEKLEDITKEDKIEINAENQLETKLNRIQNSN